MFLVSRAFASLAVINCYNFILALVEENIPETDKYVASLVVSLLSFTNGVSRVLSGFLKNCLKNFDQGIFTCWCFLLMGISSTAMTICNNLGFILLFATLFGIFQGPWNAQEIIVLLDIIDESHQSSASGIFVSLFGLWVTIAPPVYGTMYELTGSTHYGFYTSTISFIIAALFGYISILLGRSYANRSN